MFRTTFTATHATAAAAACARPCGFHAGYTWRNSEMSAAQAMTTSMVKQDNSKKRTTRRLGMATT